jgi:hypothetical protein
LNRDNAIFPDLAMALTNLGIRYGDLGQRAEALPPTLEAVKIYREQAKTNPAFLPGLAGSLTNLALFYSAFGQRSEALAPILEAVNLYRVQARANAAFVPDLAIALNVPGIVYAEQSQSERAQSILEESVKIYTQMAGQHPCRFNDDLQRSRNTLENIRLEEAKAKGETKEIALDDTRYLSPDDPDVRLRRSVVKIHSRHPDGDYYGTGLLIRREGKRGRIVTARHVILRRDIRRPPSKLVVESFGGKLPPRLSNPLQHIRFPPENALNRELRDDLVVLEVNDLPPDIQPMRLMENVPGGDLRVLGHPGKQSWEVLRLPQFKVDKEELFLVGSLDEGASGSPVLDSSGQVLGVVYEFTEFGKKNPQRVVTAYRSNTIQALLHRQL